MNNYPSWWSERVTIYNKYVDSLNGIYGYIEIGEIHFNPMNRTIYQDEIQEIVSLLKGGVIN